MLRKKRQFFSFFRILSPKQGKWPFGAMPAASQPRCWHLCFWRICLTATPKMPLLEKRMLGKVVSVSEQLGYHVRRCPVFFPTPVHVSTSSRGASSDRWVSCYVHSGNRRGQKVWQSDKRSCGHRSARSRRGQNRRRETTASVHAAKFDVPVEFIRTVPMSGGRMWAKGVPLRPAFDRQGGLGQEAGDHGFKHRRNRNWHCGHRGATIQRRRAATDTRQRQ